MFYNKNGAWNLIQTTIWFKNKYIVHRYKNINIQDKIVHPHDKISTSKKEFLDVSILLFLLHLQD